MENECWLQKAWRNTKRFFHILGIARISIFMVLLSFLLMFFVQQVEDAIISLGDCGLIHCYFIFSLVGLFWALLVWYWARIIYNLVYPEDLEGWERVVSDVTPRAIGALALVFISLAFFKQYSVLGQGDAGKTALFVMGWLFMIYAVLFFILVCVRKTIFKLKKFLIGKSATDIAAPLRNLPPVTLKILLITTAIAFILLVVFTASPYWLTSLVGNAFTIFLICLCIWLPCLYLIFYAQIRIRLPLLLTLFLLVLIFSFFNDNKFIRLTDLKLTKQVGTQTVSNEKKTPNVTEYFEQWYSKRKAEFKDCRVPIFFVLSEGGGIRATYWSAGLLSRIYDEYPDFSKYIFGIYGVSGGSFGTSLFNSLVKFALDHPGEPDTQPQTNQNQYINPREKLQTKANAIAGKDFLSPVLTAMFTRGVLQLLVPCPIDCFDQDKVFEKTWEHAWEQEMTYKKDNKLVIDQTFGKPLAKLWENDPDYRIPVSFLLTTRVDNGMPAVLTPLELFPPNDDKTYYNLGIYEEFYHYTDAYDVRVSTGSLLSARFPYIGPAGITQGGGKNAGFVDGGYYENTGAQAAYATLFEIKSYLDKRPATGDCITVENSGESSPLFRHLIKPFIIYLKNGSTTPDVKNAGNSLLYQLTVPLNTLLQVRDTNSLSALDVLKNFVNTYDGEFIPICLETDQKKQVDIPLGWVLSKTSQDEINQRINQIVGGTFKELKERLFGDKIRQTP